MSIRAHLYELDECLSNVGNEEHIIAELYKKINDSCATNYEFLVITRDEMKKIVKMLKDIAKNDGDLWDWARDYYDYDIELYSDEEAWRRWVSDLAGDIEASLKESKKDNFLIWYY